MKQIIDANDGTTFNVTDELYEVIQASIIYNEELAKWLTEEIDREILEALRNQNGG